MDSTTSHQNMDLVVVEPTVEPTVATPINPANHWKGKGKVQKSKRRHRKVLAAGITNGDIRRLARRGGIKRMNKKVFDTARSALKEFLTTIIHDAVTYTEHARRNTVTHMDVTYALKRNNMTLYGFP